LHEAQIGGGRCNLNSVAVRLLHRGGGVGRVQAIRNMSSKGSPDKALASILPLISNGQAYEAHQKARTFASRYVKAGAFGTAVQVLFQSAKELLKAGHAGSGSDLGVYMIDVYYDMDQGVNDTSRGIIRSNLAFRSLIMAKIS